MSLGEKQFDLGRNPGISLYISEKSLWKCNLQFILWQNSSKTWRCSGWLRVLWTEAKSDPFSNNFILVSVKIL